MTIKTIAATILALSVSAVTTVAATSGDPFEPEWVDSLKKCAGNKGQTAKQTYTISAGPDRVFIPETIRFVTNSAAGKKVGVWFHEHLYEMREVTAVVEGRAYKIDMPSKIVVEPFAETGSGNIGQVCAWNNGYIHAETMEIER